MRFEKPGNSVSIKASTVGVLIGAAAMVGFLFASIVLPPATRRNVVYTPGPDPLDILPEQGKAIAPLNVEAMLAASKELTNTGKSLYALRCVSCHGSEGLGSGPAGTVLTPPPRNFTSENGWKNGFTVAAIFGTLSEGLGGMPSFDYLSAEERFALAHYVQSFGHFAHGPESADAAHSLDRKYKLSQGGFEPNKVSIKVAVERLLAEQKPASLNMPDQAEQSAEAELLHRVIREPQRVALLLSRSAGWQEDAAVLLKIAALGAPANGFSPGVGTLSQREGNLLLSAMRSRLVR